ncbi:MAG: acyltransferase [Bacteroidetes bacterium]|nr:acyltransferase [Bacteroidota bacterium]
MFGSLKYRFNQLTEDHGSWWTNKYHHLKMKVFRAYSGFFANIQCTVKGIKLGHGTEFYGQPFFHRYPHSNIMFGDNCTIRSDQTSNQIGVNHKCILSTHKKGAILRIGNNCGLSGVSIGAAMEISIGNNVLFGANVIVTDWDWHEDRIDSQPAPVIIHDNVWIGVNSTVLKGVTIGENSIIGANSLVVKDIPANVIAGGNPCKVLRTK